MSLSLKLSPSSFSYPRYAGKEGEKGENEDDGEDGEDGKEANSHAVARLYNW
jgi:hypothetical protein